MHLKKLYPLLAILATPVILVLMSGSGGSSGGKTGSIGDNGNTCTQCHGGTATPTFGWITTNVPIGGYTPGQTYTITATGTHAGVVKFGFELTVENSDGDKVGTLIITDPARTRFTNSNQAVTHTAAGNIPAGNTNSWSMNWVAPSGVSGNVGIYAAFNAANGNGNTSGDIIYKSSKFISQFAPTPALTGIVPDQAEQGSLVSTTITAENTSFEETEPAVSMTLHANPGELINASSVTVVNNTTLQVDFDIPYLATPGLWDLHVDDLLLENSFTVIDVVPFLVSIVPDSALRDETVTTLITAADSRFTLIEPEVFLDYSGDPLEIIEPVSVNVINDETLEAVFSFPADASAGLWHLNVDDMILENAFTVLLVSGLADNNLNMSQIYPNPANQHFIADNAREADLSIYNAGGEMVLRIKVLDEKQVVNVNHLARGLYLVKMQLNGVTRVEKLLVN